MADDTTRAGAPRWFPPRLGPCRLVRVIGRGASGTVFESELTEDVPRHRLSRGDRVAVKLLHPERLGDPGAFQRMVREASLGGRVTHPGVVRVHWVDAEVVAQVTHHYLVMELVEGRTLREICSPRSPLPEALVRSIGAQLAHALAAVHAAGAVHRDVKPDNVLLTPAQQVKLVDLGVAREAKAPATTTGDFLGTLGYAAPEHLDGHATPASDLYALGVVLFEAVTGVQPFAADDAIEIVRRHAALVPPRAGALNPQVSALLEELLARLLSKSEADRPAGAAEVAAILEEGERSAWWHDREASLRRESPSGVLRRARVARRTPLIGREDAVASLRSAWDEAGAGRGGLVVVTGEPGSGKSRLLDDLASAVEGDPAARVLFGERQASGGLGGLGAALTSAFGEDALETALARRLGVSSRMAPALAAAVSGLPTPGSTERLDADVMGSALSRVFRALAAERPTLLLLEDLHAADEEEIAVARAVFESAAGSRLLVVASARAGTADELARVGSLPSSRRIELGRLDAAQVQQVLAEALQSEDLARVMGPTVARRSDGNPLFVLQLVDELEQRRALRRRTDGSYESLVDLHDVSLPGSLRDLLRARIDGVAEADRALLEAGAIEGYTFDPGMVAAVLSRKRLAVLQDLARLERRTGVVRADGARFRFDHHQLHEAVLDAMPPSLLAEYHLLVADALAQARGIDPGSDEPRGADAALLAHHLLLGGEAGRAARLVRPALAHLDLQRRHDDLVALADRALALVAAPASLRCEVALDLASCHDLLGRRDRQLAAARTAVAAATDDGSASLRARSLVAQGRALALSQGADDAEASLREAQALAPEGRVEVAALGALGWILVQRRRHDEAQPLLERAAAISRLLGDDRDTAWSLTRLAQLRQEQGHAAEACALLEEAEAIARRRGDDWMRTLALANLARAHGMSGDHERARALLGEQLALARDISYRKGEATALGNLGLVHLECGEWEEARRCFAQQESLAHQMAWVAGRATAFGHLGDAMLALGRAADAWAATSSEEAVARESDDAMHLARCLVRRCRLASSAGRHADSERWAAESRAIAEASRAEPLAARALVRGAAAAAHQGRSFDGGAIAAGLASLRESATPPDLARELVLAAECAPPREPLAVSWLREAASIASRLGIVDPGPLPAAMLAELGEAEPEDGADDERAPVLVRAATRLALFGATGRAPLLPQARGLLEGFAASLPDDGARETFWRDAPLARRLRAAGA